MQRRTRGSASLPLRLAINTFIRARSPEGDEFVTEPFLFSANCDREEWISMNGFCSLKGLHCLSVLNCSHTG